MAVLPHLLALVALVSVGSCKKTPPREERPAPGITASVVPPVLSVSSSPERPAAADCRENGCLRRVEHVGDYDKQSLVAAIPRSIAIDNGYSVYTITFFTSGRDARATVTIPFGIAPPASGWHAIANAHGTTGLDDPCAVAGTIWGAGYAGTFGARGAVGIAVDYPGLGTPGLHPYLVADSEGHAVLDALRATRQLAATKGTRLSRRFAVVGLSQGGHATLATAMRHKSYAPEIDIRAFAAVGPASGFEEHWRAGAALDGWHVPVHAMLIHAWAQEYGHRGPELWSPKLSPHVSRLMREGCMYSPIGAPALSNTLGSVRSEVFSPEFLRAFQTGAWGEFALFGEAFRKNRIRPFAQTAPIKIYQGDRDDIVPEWSTRELVESLRAGGVKVDYEIVPGGGHAGIAFGGLVSMELRTNESLAWLREKLD